MQPLAIALLLVIAATWVVAWRSARRFCAACSVTEPISRGALACVLPSAGLTVSVHGLATAAMLTGRGCLTLEAVTIVFAILTALYCRVIGSAQRAAGFSPRGVPHKPNPTPHPLGIWWMPLAVVTMMYVVFLIDAVTRYPTGYDAVNYHLPMAFKWAREGAMNLVIGHSGYSWPGNGMILACLLAFTRLEPLLAIVQLPVALLLGAAVFGFARGIDLKPRAAVLCVCITMSVPIVVFQSFSGYIDIFAAAWCLTAMLAVVWATRTHDDHGRRGLIILAGLAAGIALGSKSTYLVIVAILAMVVFAFDRTANRGVKSTRNVALFCGAVLVCSGFWFARGIVQAHNPVYPIVLETNHEGLLPRIGIVAVDSYPPDEQTWIAKLLFWGNFPWRETKLGSGYTYGVDNGLGAAFATFVPLGFIVSILRRSARRQSEIRKSWHVILVALALVGAVLLLTVFQDMLRLALPWIILSIPLGVVGLQRVIAAFPRSTALLLTAALAVTASVATLKPVHALMGRFRDGRWDRAWFYQIAPIIDELEPGSRIVNLSLDPLTYPLLGRHLSNVPISLNHWNALSESGQVTAEALSENAIDYLLVREPWPDDWPEGLPVELVYDDSETRAVATTPPTRIYRVIGPGDDSHDG